MKIKQSAKDFTLLLIIYLCNIWVYSATLHYGMEGSKMPHEIWFNLATVSALWTVELWLLATFICQMAVKRSLPLVAPPTAKARIWFYWNTLTSFICVDYVDKIFIWEPILFFKTVHIQTHCNKVWYEHLSKWCICYTGELQQKRAEQKFLFQYY